MPPIALHQMCSLVAPGDQTGVYYIIVCGLGWKHSWQDLKDFARNYGDNSTAHKDIDRVEVFGTNGWVRVIGKESFLKIRDHLNGGQLEGRSLIADGRNETCWTIILKALDTQPEQRQHYPVRQPQYLHGNVYVGNFTPVTPLYAAPPVLIPARFPTYMVPPPTPEMMICPIPVPYQPPALVTTEARKIVITKLAHSVDEATLEALLRGVTLSHSSPGSQCHVKTEIAYHTSGERKGERKDHAFCVFESAALARRAIRALNGYEFHGRRIAVKLAKEGERPLRSDPAPLCPHVSSRPSRSEEKSSNCNDVHVGSANALKIGIELSSRTPAVVDGSSTVNRCRNRSAVR